MKITILGDSVIDNEDYIAPDEKDTVEHAELAFRAFDAEVDSFAKDGFVINDVITKYQREGIPRDTTHLFISVGGNDLLGIFEWLLHPSGDHQFGSILAKFDDLRCDFSADYGKMLDLISEQIGDEVKVCLFDIYYPNWQAEVYRGLPPHSPVLERACNAAIDLWNAKIHYHAYQRGFGLLPLSHLFRGDASMYANTIEPSSKGSSVIAEEMCKIALHKG